MYYTTDNRPSPNPPTTHRLVTANGERGTCPVARVRKIRRFLRRSEIQVRSLSALGSVRLEILSVRPFCVGLRGPRGQQTRYWPRALAVVTVLGVGGGLSCAIKCNVLRKLCEIYPPAYNRFTKGLPFYVEALSGGGRTFDRIKVPRWWFESLPYNRCTIWIYRKHARCSGFNLIWVDCVLGVSYCVLNESVQREFCMFCSNFIPSS